MEVGASDACRRHDPGGGHPDRPARLDAVLDALMEEPDVSHTTPPPAAPDALRAVHTPEHVSAVRSRCAEGGGVFGPDTIASRGTWTAALASAGLAIWAATAAFDGATGQDTPFAVGRPPGHHAVPDGAMGFCFFNNVAIATEVVLDRPGADRVAIVDWDVHHGNGTQATFYERGDVCYSSIHERGAYPGTGPVGATGTGEGAGTTVNVPLPSTAGDAGYVAALDEVIAPAVRSHDPDLVLVSGGFDAHRRDTIAGHNLTDQGYGALARRIRSLGDAVSAPIAFVLEGGYDQTALAASVRRVNAAFGGRAAAEPEGSLAVGVDRALAAATAAQSRGEK